MELELAEQTSLLALGIGARLDNHLRLIQEQCSEQEFSEYRASIGTVMGELLTGLMQPIYDQHPTLRPEQLGGSYVVDLEALIPN